MPFNAAAVLREWRIDPAAPVTASLRLPSTSLAFLKKLSPKIEELRGRASAQIDLAGTIRNPALSGSFTVDLPRLHVDAPALHDVRDVRLDLRFREQTLFVETATAKLAGGPLRLSGTVQFPELTKPVLDLAVRGDSVLLVRNDSVTAHADFALTLTGPLATARLAGSAGLVESEFFREAKSSRSSSRAVPRPPWRRARRSPSRSPRHRCATGRSTLRSRRATPSSSAATSRKAASWRTCGSAAPVSPRRSRARPR